MSEQAIKDILTIESDKIKFSNKLCINDRAVIIYIFYGELNLFLQITG